MAKNPPRTVPDHEQTGWPSGIPYIVGNEACERFSYYGLQAILQPHIAFLYATILVGVKLATTFATTKPIAVPWGATEWFLNVWRAVAEAQSSHDVHMFIASAYALPMIGAIIADKWLGKYLTIMSLSLVYCAGHVALALGENSVLGMHLGLALIALGTGGIKPCVAAHIGDQFGRKNWHLQQKAFQFFYMSVNFGSFFSVILVPLLLVKFGPRVAFGLPGVLMFIATVVFWWGRTKFIHVPGKPGGKIGMLDSVGGGLLFIGFFGSWLFGPEFGLGVRGVFALAIPSVIAGFVVFAIRERVAPNDGFIGVALSTIMRGLAATKKRLGDESVDGMQAVLRVLSVILFISVFWALFDQHYTTWVSQAKMMDLEVFGITILPPQMSAVNPIMVLIFIPFLLYVVFPFFERRGWKVTQLRRMGVGMALAGFSFVCAALVQNWCDAGQHPSILWQLPQYAIITFAEVLVSTTGLEFAYGQAPRRMKSTIMGLWNLQITFGNVIAAVVIGEHGLNAGMFWMFTVAMVVFAAVFIARAAFYRYRDYPQE